MITHSIVVYTPPKVVPRKFSKKRNKSFEVGSEDHKRQIFDRAIGECKWEVGDCVRFKGVTYNVIHLIETFEECTWDGFSPLLVGIWNEFQDFDYVHPNRLKAVK